MSDWTKLETSAEVCAVIRARHHAELIVHATFSDPDGTFNVGPGECGRMDTAYAIKGCDWPIIEYRTTWIIDHENPHQRIDEKHEYWLCVPIAAD